MSQRIVISESQYSRLFLNEQTDNAVKNKDCNIKGKWVNGWDAPFDWTIKDPFKDGYDYQWKVWADCERHWVRKSVKNRGNGKWGIYDDNSGLDLEKTGWKTYPLKGGKKGIIRKVYVSGGDNFRFIKEGDPIPDGFKPYYTGFIDDNEGVNDSKLYTKLEKYKKRFYDKILNKRKYEEEKVKTRAWKEMTFNEGNKTLKAWGWPTVPKENMDYYLFIPNYEDIQPAMINEIGYKYLREIENYKSNLLGGYDVCRMVYFWTLGNDSPGNGDRVLIESMDAYGTLERYKEKRTFLPSAAKHPWMCYFVMGQVYHGGNVPNQNWNAASFEKETGVHNYGNWFDLVYGTKDINKIKSMCKDAMTNPKTNRSSFPCVPHSSNSIMLELRKKHGVKVKGPMDTLNAFGKWIDSWNTQDWIDAASIVLYLIPTPVTWGLATALEIGNASISLAKGNYGEASMRAGFLLGGVLLSKALSVTYKASKESAEELITVLGKTKGKSEKEIAKILQLERESMSSGGKKLLDDITLQVGKGNNSELVKWANKNNKFMERIDVLMRQGMNERRAVRQSLKETFGENMYHKLWKHVAPTTKVEGGIMGLLYGVMQTYSYKKFKEELIKKGASEDQINNYLDDLIDALNIDTDEESDEMMAKSLSLFNEYELREGIGTLPLYDNFTDNCSQGFEDITDKKLNQDITSGGISVKAGGNYDYKIYPDLTSEDSWVYTKGSSEKTWRKGNCKTTEKVFNSYCKKNVTYLDTVEGNSCLELMGGEEYEKIFAYISNKFKDDDGKLTVQEMDEISDGIVDMMIDW